MAKVSEGVKPKHSNGRESRARALAYEVIKASEGGELPTKADLLRRAGYTESVAQKGKTNPNGTPWTSEAFRETLANSGFTVQKLNKIYEDASQANVVAVFQGEANETNVPDHAMRLKAAKDIAELSGLHVKRTQSVNVNIDTNAEEMSALLGI
jgi:hypothetical protein